MALFWVICAISGTGLWYVINAASKGRLRTGQKQFYRNLNNHVGMGEIKEDDGDDEDPQWRARGDGG